MDGLGAPGCLHYPPDSPLYTDVHGQGWAGSPLYQLLNKNEGLYDLLYLHYSTAVAAGLLCVDSHVDQVGYSGSVVININVPVPL